LRNQGWSYNKIAAHFGCSRTAATNALLRFAGGAQCPGELTVAPLDQNRPARDFHTD
jgi:hypothetical protein